MSEIVGKNNGPTPGQAEGFYPQGYESVKRLEVRKLKGGEKIFGYVDFGTAEKSLEMPDLAEMWGHDPDEWRKYNEDTEKWEQARLIQQLLHRVEAQDNKIEKLEATIASLTNGNTKSAEPQQTEETQKDTPKTGIWRSNGPLGADNYPSEILGEEEIDGVKCLKMRRVDEPDKFFFAPANEVEIQPADVEPFAEAEPQVVEEESARVAETDAIAAEPAPDQTERARVNPWHRFQLRLGNLMTRNVSTHYDYDDQGRVVEERREERRSRAGVIGGIALTAAGVGIGYLIWGRHTGHNVVVTAPSSPTHPTELAHGSIVLHAGSHTDYVNPAHGHRLTGVMLDKSLKLKSNYDGTKSLVKTNGDVVIRKLEWDSQGKLSAGIRHYLHSQNYTLGTTRLGKPWETIVQSS